MRYLKILSLILIFFFLSSCSNSNISEKIDYIKISSENNSKIFHGVVKANISTILSFQSEGKIIFLPYTKGDFIKKGEVIARLDGELYKIRKNEETFRLKQAKVNYEKQKSYYERMNILYKQGGISQNDWEDAFYELQAIEQEIKTQKEKINYLNKEIDYNILTAPYDGYISQKISDIGTYAKIGQPIVEIINSDGFQVEIMVNQNIVNEINLNEEVQIEILNKMYQGKISHISKSSLNSGGYLVKISLLNPKDVKEGMSADVKISFLNNFYTIPLKCVFQEENNKFVYKIINLKDNIGEIKKVKIETGEIINDEIEILNGVNNFDLIICANNKNFKEKEKIKL